MTNGDKSYLEKFQKGLRNGQIGENYFVELYERSIRGDTDAKEELMAALHYVDHGPLGKLLGNIHALTQEGHDVLLTTKIGDTLSHTKFPKPFTEE